MKVKNSNQIKQIETHQVIPQLNEKVIATPHSKLLPAYYILREAFKDKQFVKLSIAKNYIVHYTGVNVKTAYAYLETSCPFWAILPTRKNIRGKRLTITPFPKLCAIFDIFPILDVLLVKVKDFHASIAFRKARIFQDTVCKKGASKIIDKLGVFGRQWKKMKNGKMKPESTSVGEIILHRNFNYPVSRSTIEERTDVPRSTQIRYGKLLRMRTGFQTFFNFSIVEELTRSEFQCIQNRSCNLDLIDKIMNTTNHQFLGAKYKARRIGDSHYITEQLPNSYQSFVLRASSNQIRKLNHKVKKLVSNGKMLCKKVNNFFFGPRYSDDGYYYEGAWTLRSNIKQAFWAKIENGQRKVFYVLDRLKDYAFKDLKDYLHTNASADEKKSAKFEKIFEKKL